ncbi:MAG: response regulator transcription factor [Prevotella sp.]|nr:response regulator transcription factor [Prevotella sp.]
MKTSLSPTELQIAELYCHGLIDKEISEQVQKPIWTVRNHKRHIYQKLGISTTHELVLWMVCRYLGKTWNLRELRLRGLSAILCVLLLFQALNGNSPERQFRSNRRANTSVRARGGGRSQRTRTRTREWY